MKTWLVSLACASVLFSVSVSARDDVSDYDIQSVLATEQAQSKLGSSISFYFGDQPYGEPTKNFGVFSTNKKTNAFNKSDEEACNWVFLSALLELRSRAVKEGGNAVVEIKSNYKGNETTSEDTFQCGAGTFVAGVALKGRVVAL